MTHASTGTRPQIPTTEDFANLLRYLDVGTNRQRDSISDAILLERISARLLHPEGNFQRIRYAPSSAEDILSIARTLWPSGIRALTTATSIYTQMLRYESQDHRLLLRTSFRFLRAAQSRTWKDWRATVPVQ